MLAAAVVLLSSSVGRAEAGDGFKAGNLALSPELQVFGAYDTNVFRLDSDEVAPGEDVPSSPVLGIAPGLEITTPNPSNFDFQLDSSVLWEQYLSSEQVVRDQSGLSADGKVSGRINPNGNVSFELHDKIQYKNEPPTTASSDSFDRLVNRVGGGLGIHPGDRILQIDLIYDWARFVYFHPSLLDLDKSEHQRDLDLKWRFLPKTALVLQSDFDVIRYDVGRRGVAGAGLPNTDGTPFHTKAGLSGLFTRRLSTRLLAGYANGFYESGPSYSAFIGEARIAYKIGPIDADNEIALQYERSFRDSPVSNFFSMHRAQLSYEHSFFDERFGIFANGQFIYRDYAPLQAPRDDRFSQFKVVRNNRGEEVLLPTDMHDRLWTAKGGVESKFLDWWKVKLSYEFSTNQTDDQTDVLDAQLNAPRATFRRQFVRHYVQLSTTISY
ncbi:MAG: hypothetical protein ABEL76_14990 [Bradymonadaceae bacterium]